MLKILISFASCLAVERREAIFLSTGYVILALVIAGCSSRAFDSNVMSACRTHLDSYGKFAQVDPAGCLAAGREYDRRKAAQDRQASQRAKNTALAAAERDRQNLAAARRAAAEQARRAAMSPAEKRREHQRSATARKKMSASNAAASQRLTERWNDERRLALQDNRATLRRFPEIAWLNGIWCLGKTGIVYQRNEILKNGRIRMVTYTKSTWRFRARISEKTWVVRQRDGLFMITTAPEDWNRNRNPYKIPYSEWAIKRLGESRYDRVWTRTIYRKGPGRKKILNNKYKYDRCAVG